MSVPLFELSRGEEFLANGRRYTVLNDGHNWADGSISVREANPNLHEGGYLFDRFSRMAIVELTSR